MHNCIAMRMRVCVHVSWRYFTTKDYNKWQGGVIIVHGFGK